MEVVVVGSTGLIGSNLVTSLEESSGTNIKTVSRRAQSSPHHYQIDLLKAEAASEIPRCDVLFYAAGISGFENCRRFPDHAKWLNVDLPCAIARRFNSPSQRFVQFSSNVVFDCKEEQMESSRAYSPRGLYGELHSIAEQRVLELPSSLILRSTKLLSNSWELLHNWHESLKYGVPISAFIDHKLSPVPIDYLARVAISAVKAMHVGVLQISATDSISYFDMGKLLADDWGFDSSLIKGVSKDQDGLLFNERISAGSLKVLSKELNLGFELRSSADNLRYLVSRSSFP